MKHHARMNDDVKVRALRSGDENLVVDAAHLFDNPPRLGWAETFLSTPTHHLLIAYRDAQPLGFVTGVEMTHPDKGTEMFVYELSVAPEERRQGVARSLLADLARLARDRGCYGMWVLTDDDNVAAIGAYTASGARRDGEHVMLSWDWEAADLR